MLTPISPGGDQSKPGGIEKILEDMRREIERSQRQPKVVLPPPSPLQLIILPKNVRVA